MEWISDIEELSVSDIYMTYKGTYRGLPCVLKFFVDENYDNHEWELFHYFQQHSKHPEWYPRPYFIDRSISEMDLPVFGQIEKVEGIFKIICYEYLPAKEDIRDHFSPNKACIELVEHLNDMHKLGIIHADVLLHNMIIGADNRYKMIDYGNSFSDTNKQFPPLDYMVRSGEPVPTMVKDIASLSEVIEGATPKRICVNCGDRL